ncbi:MAG: hypothetical protein Q4Q22_02305 [Methanosphaera sp.]|nr:hypothetical protein [Methanosphaera sp.]
MWECIKIKNITFKDIADIYSGIRNTQFKNKEKIFKYHSITLTKDNDFEIDIDKSDALYTDKPLDEKYLLRKGNIILRLTPPYTSRLVEFNRDNLTTTSNYAIIKVKEDYSPEVLNFYLNSTYTKKQIYKYCEQTSVKVVNISSIKNFKINNINNYENINYINLLKTFTKKRKLIQKELSLEENILEELFFGE